MPPLYVPLPNANSGTAIGRVETPLFVDRQLLTAAAAYASPDWLPGFYREIRWTMRANTTGGTVVMKLRGVAAGYSSRGTDGSSDASQVSAAEASAVWDITGQWNIAVDGFVRTCSYHSCKAAAAAAITAMLFAKGSTIDVTTPATGFDVTFSSNVTGIIELWGVPA